LARTLIAGEFPGLELGSLRLLAESWDNAVWVVDERWVWFPRRAIEIAGVQREIDVLPRLAPQLPLAIRSYPRQDCQASRVPARTSVSNYFPRKKS